MCDDPAVSDLVTRARDGDQQAWDALVERHAPLIWSICRRYRLGGADAEDAAQAVWLRLVDHNSAPFSCVEIQHHRQRRVGDLRGIGPRAG